MFNIDQFVVGILYGALAFWIAPGTYTDKTIYFMAGAITINIMNIITAFKHDTHNN